MGDTTEEPDIKIVDNIATNITDLKMVSDSRKSYINACVNNGKCSHFCAALPGRDSKFECKCPEEMTLDDDNKFDCSCNPKSFHCLNKLCIPVDMWCNELDDCGDNSDELSCPETSGELPCPYNMIKCESEETCVDEKYVCDNKKHCSDGSDERNCDMNFNLANGNTTCPKYFHSCNDGKCIWRSWLCGELTIKS